MIQRIKNKKGFTLVELLVVIAIIGILAAVIAPHAFKAVEKSKLTKMIQDCKAIEASALNHYADTGKFPEVYNVSQVNMQDFLNQDSDHPKDGWNGPYLERWPKNPFNTGNLNSQQDYQWDYRKIDGDSATGDFVIEISLDGVEKWEDKAIWIDQTIENGDGPSAGKIRWTNQWVTWVVAVDAPQSGQAAH